MYLLSVCAFSMFGIYMRIIGTACFQSMMNKLEELKNLSMICKTPSIQIRFHNLS